MADEDQIVVNEDEAFFDLVGWAPQVFPQILENELKKPTGVAEFARAVLQDARDQELDSMSNAMGRAMDTLEEMLDEFDERKRERDMAVEVAVKKKLPMGIPAETIRSFLGGRNRRRKTRRGTRRRRVTRKFRLFKK